MKKKLFIFLAVLAMVVCVCAISVSADTLVPSTSNEYGELSVVDGVPVPTVIDKNAKSVVVVNGTYYTIPTYYLIADNSEFIWGVNSAVVSALGLPSDSSVRNNVVRIEIPEGIITSDEISDGGKKFERVATLVEASFPSSMTLIGEYFFSECSNLKTVKGLENTKITKIYRNSFYNCSALESIALPSTVAAIDTNAFRNASSITSVVIPDAVTTIGDHAFAACKSLATVTISENSQLKKLEGEYHFEETKITSFYFPSCFEKFGNYAFLKCTSLETIINFENTLITELGAGAFNKCSSLKSISFPATLTKLNGGLYDDNGTLEGCTSLKSITIPASLKDVYGNLCQNCSGLETLIFEDRLLPDGTYNPLTFHAWAPFENCKSLTKVVLPEGLTNLPNGMFNSCSKLESITFASTITSISGGSHFNGTALNEVIGLENTKIQYIANSMFRNCKLWTGDENGVVRLPNTVKYIEGYGLADVKMTTLILGASFEYITEGNTHSFAGTTELKYVYAPASTTKLSQGNANFQHIFVTSSDETVIETLKTTTGIANVITFAQYEAGEYTEGTKYIITGYNLCDAFYDGHLEGSEQTGDWTGDKFLSNYQITCPCGRNCGVVTVIKDLKPLFTTKGYSTSGSAMMQSFAINKALWESEYSVLFPELKYGMVAAYKGANDSGFDTTSGKIVNADCTGVNTKVAIVDMTERDYDVFEIKISGVGAEDYKATTFFLCAYVVLDGTVYYIDNGTTGESATGASYNDVEAFVSPEYGYVGKEEE